MFRDRGVRSDILYRRFKWIDKDLAWRRGRLPPDRAAHYYDSKVAEIVREKNRILSEFEMMQESRPLKPRGKL